MTYAVELVGGLCKPCVPCFRQLNYGHVNKANLNLTT